MIWGLDTSSRCTGITAGTGEKMPAVGVWQFDHCGDDIGQLLFDFDRSMVELAGRMPPTIIIFEAPLLKRHDTLLKLRKLYSVAAYVELFGRRCGAKVEEASAKRLKKVLTGNHEASKGDMVAMCKKLGVRLPAGPPAEDAADSFAAWVYGVQLHAKEHRTQWDQAIFGRRGALL